MIRNTVQVAFAILALAALSPAGEIKLARHPSYHAGKIAFSYAGDIWVVNENGADPRRLTIHIARDVYPRFSPDGKWIAFSSNRFGNYDVFVMPSAGGQPQRLTYHSGADTVVGWSRDSRKVIFAASRGMTMPGVATLFEISTDGGNEEMVPTGWGTYASYSPDGRQLAFTRHGGSWWRLHYRGSRAADLWVMDLATQKSRKLSDGGMAPNWFWPMWGSGDIFFVSDRMANEKEIKAGSPQVLKSVNNLWKISDRGGKPVQVTQHTSGRLFFPSMSSDGKVIVYEENAGLWKLDTSTGKTSEIKIQIETDDKENTVETITYTSEADSFDLSPSTRRAVISIRGELFTIATERGDTTRIAESPARDTQPAWSPDGKWIAFISDRSGQDELWICDTNGDNLKKLSASAREKSGLEWAPDSKSFLYSSSDKSLYRVNIDDGQTQVVATGDVGRISAGRFSPDGKWISYTRQDRTFRPRVYVVPAAGGEARRITEDDLFSDSGAVWSRDGKHILFVAGMMQGGGIAQQRQTTSALYVLPLLKQEKDPVSRDVDTEEEAAAAAPAARREPAPGGPQAAAPEVKIDWEGLTRRSRRLAPLAGNVSAIASSPDGRSAAFVIVDTAETPPRQAIYTIGIDGQRMTRIYQSQPPSAEDGPPAGGPGGGLGSPAYSRDGRTLFFREGRAISAVGAGAPGADAAAPAAPAAARTEARRRITFTARVEVDHRAEPAQIFNESWRIMKHRFYDANMHGVDWDKVKAVYEPLLAYAHDSEELQNIISQMIGELNASHTGISGGGRREAGEAAQTRYPGFDVAPDPGGYFKLTHIYKTGPADREFVQIKPGNFILAIDDVELKTGDNYWQRLTSAPGRKFKLLVNSKPSREGAWEVRIDSISGAQHGTLQYEKWVAERRAIVDRLANGEIGYLHIRSMNAESLQRFERELIENSQKKALVIDQRFNGGGGIEQELLQILQQRRYEYTISRDSVQVWRPQRAFFGPMVVMQNERSGSNAEMFPHGFRELKLGKTVGVPTFGGVIGTGSYSLIDGSSVRTPGSGVYTWDGINMENYGVPPDIYVDNTPDDFLAGRDVQLEKAVEALQSQLRTAPGKN